MSSNLKLKRIFLDHWEGYLEHAKNHGIKVRPVEIQNVTKMLACRTPLLGMHQYKCENCGYAMDIVHSCKSRFCSSCGTPAMENWINDRFSFLLDCSYQHVVVTIPHTFNGLIKHNRKAMLNFYSRCIADTITEYTQERGWEPAMVFFLHTFGANLQFHVHFHVLVTVGGLKKDGTWQYTDKILPPQILMPRFKAKFCDGVKNMLKDNSINWGMPLGGALKLVNKTYDHHWQFYTKAITTNKKSTIAYCARYAKRMVMSERRIVGYDGKVVEFFSGKDDAGKKQVIAYPVYQFIQCLLQHIPEKNFKLIRYYGFYANKSKKKYTQARKYWQPLQPPQDKLLWHHRQWKLYKRDPMLCPHCYCYVVSSNTRIVLT